MIIVSFDVEVEQGNSKDDPNAITCRICHKGIGSGNPKMFLTIGRVEHQNAILSANFQHKHCE